jgi:hypothetical protein
MKLTVAKYYKYLPWPEEVMRISPPKQILLNRKYYPVFTDLKNEITFGQKVMLCMDSPDTNHQWLKKILTYIYQPLIQKCKFDVDKAKLLEPLIERCRIIEAFPTTMFYLDQLAKINEDEEQSLKNDPEPESIAAGIDQLNKFGIFAAVDSLAQGNPLKYEQIYELPYSTVFTKLWLDTERAKFEKRLSTHLKMKK